MANPQEKVVTFQQYHKINTDRLKDDLAVSSFHQLRACLNDIHTWMFESKLKLNSGKTEFIVFKWLRILSLSTFWKTVSYQLTLFAFWVYCLAKKSSLTNQVNLVIKSCFASLCDLHCNRHFLSYDVSVMVANALVSSRLDYCNSLFRSFYSKNIIRLQNKQNCLARFVSDSSRFTHITPTLKSLHWLPVKQQIIFKILVPVYKYLTTGKPKYFSQFLSFHTSVIKTRCSNP